MSWCAEAGKGRDEASGRGRFACFRALVTPWVWRSRGEGTAVGEDTVGSGSRRSLTEVEGRPGRAVILRHSVHLSVPSSVGDAMVDFDDASGVGAAHADFAQTLRCRRRDGVSAGASDNLDTATAN